MTSEVVIGIDCSTTTTKAIAWDAAGKNVAEGRCVIPLASPRANYYEQNPADWWRSTVSALREVTAQIDKEKIAALAIANQRETVVALDKKDEPVRPAIIWLDERCKDQVDKFASLIGEDRIHQITGKPKDYAPVVYRLAWMKEHESDLFRQVVQFCDVHSYLVRSLTGSFKTSWASADPLGLFDLENKKWSSDILKQLELSSEQLPEACCPGTILGHITRAAAEVTGLKRGTPVVAGGGDGQAAGLGVNAMGPTRAYLNLGTAVVAGMFAENYIIDTAFRTMASCSQNGYYCETSLRAGTFLIDWLVQQVLNVDREQQPNIYQALENEARQIPTGSEGLLLIPYWNAVMNPYWDPDARGCILGLSSSHHRGHLYRAILEGIAMEQSNSMDFAERAVGNRADEFAVIGGGAKSALWCQIIADACDKNVIRMASEEASSLGAGISAAVAAGWYSSFKEAAESMTRVDNIIESIPQNVERYQDLLTVYREVYPGVQAIYK